MKKKEITVRCPECETVNRAFGKDKYINCVICGNKLKVKGGSNSESSKTLYIVLAMLIIVLLLLIFLFIKSVNNENTRGVSENEKVLYYNAQVVYSSALDYCVKARLNETPLNDGIYIILLQGQDDSPQFSGEKDDLELYFSAYYNQDYQQYFGVSIKQGLPSVAYWSIEPIDQTVTNMSQTEMIQNRPDVGFYPFI